MSLQNLASAYREGILAFVWRQWAQLGLSASRTRRDRWCQDPEALLVFSLEIARQEPRMFDEILDWLCENGHEMMTHRLKNIIDRDPETPRHVIDAALEKTKTVKGARGSEKPAASEPLFAMFDLANEGSEPFDPVFSAHGLTRPIFSPSGKSRPIRLQAPVAFAFKLRAVFGASTRSEALRYLLLRQGHQAGTSEVAEAALLSRYGLQQALGELSQAGLVSKGSKGRKDWIWWMEDVSPLEWLYPADGTIPEWIGWPAVYQGLIRLWRWLHAPERQGESPYIQASGARAVMADARVLLSHQGLRWQTHDPAEHPGAGYWDVFATDVTTLIAALNEDESLARAQYASIADAIGHRRFSKTRTIEVPSGLLEAPSVSGQASGLSFTWRAFEGSSATVAKVATQSPMLSLPGGMRKAGQILPAAEFGHFEGGIGDATFRLENVHVVGHAISHSTDQVTKIRLRYDAARLDHGDAAPAYMRYILSNVRFRIWPQATRTTDGHWRRDVLHFTHDGAPLQLTELDEKEGLASLVIGARSEEKQGIDLAQDVARLLSFLLGAPVQILARESFDADGEPVNETWFPSIRAATPGRYAPVDWETNDEAGRLYAARLPEIFTRLLGRYIEMKTSYGLAAVIDCLVSSNPLPIEAACLLKLTALKKMSSAWTTQSTPKSGIRRQAAPFPFMGALDISLETNEAERLKDLIEAADSGSLLTTTDRTQFQAKLSALGTLTKLSNACLLRLLDYEGPIVDYGKIGYPSVPITAPATS